MLWRMQQGWRLWEGSREDAVVPLRTLVSQSMSPPHLTFCVIVSALVPKAGVMGRERRWAKPQGRPEKLGKAGF